MITDVAKALTAVLWNAGFPAERRFTPRRNLEDYATLRVTVVARADDVDLEDGTRGARKRTYTLDVAYQQRLADVTATDPEQQRIIEETELDLHERRIDDLLAALDPETVGTLAGCQIVGLNRYAGEEAPYSMRHMTDMRLYTAVVKVTLEEYREVS